MSFHRRSSDGSYRRQPDDAHDIPPVRIMDELELPFYHRRISGRAIPSTVTEGSFRGL
jgi:hypothetical protein